ncbi:MAG: hypothetical protein KAI24_16880 [Planctomycetes bacterium]|nr:hypothetical protein [Planctomycetota bacterium]
MLVCVGLLLRPLLLPLHLLLEEHSYEPGATHTTAHLGHAHPHAHPHVHVHLHAVDDDGDDTDRDTDPDHPPHPAEDHTDGAAELLPAPPPPPALTIALCLPTEPDYQIPSLRACGRLCPPTPVETPRPPPRTPAQPRAPPAIA